jgi:hypothetical protein
MKAQIVLLLVVALAFTKCDDVSTASACNAVTAASASKAKCNDLSEGNIDCCYAVTSVGDSDTKACIAFTTTVDFEDFWEPLKKAADALDADYSLDCSAKSVSVSMMFFALIALFFF